MARWNIYFLIDSLGTSRRINTKLYWITCTDKYFPFLGELWTWTPLSSKWLIEILLLAISREEIDDALSEDVNSTEQDCRIEDCRSNRIFKLRPINQIADHLQLLPSEWLEDLTKHSEAIETFHKLHAKHAAKYEPSERLKEYPKIVFLGTGASCPDKSRNVAGILVRLRSVQILFSRDGRYSQSCGLFSNSSANSVLLDCGEGTLGQLYRFYGDKTNDILATLKAIFVSHMHVDHYMGKLSLYIRISHRWMNSPRLIHRCVQSAATSPRNAKIKWTACRSNWSDGYEETAGVVRFRCAEC